MLTALAKSWVSWSHINTSKGCAVGVGTVCCFAMLQGSLLEVSG